MKTVDASKFKAKCIAILREAQRSGEAILITRRGQPLARIEPITERPEQRRLGVHRGRMRLNKGVDLPRSFASHLVTRVMRVPTVFAVVH